MKKLKHFNILKKIYQNPQCRYCWIRVCWFASGISIAKQNVKIIGLDNDLKTQNS